MNSPTSRNNYVIAAKVYLEMRGYTIIELNWHRSRSRIDIVAQKAEVIYFVEVKYFDNDYSGEVDALTKSKLESLHRAAEAWLEENKWHGRHAFAIIEISGKTLSVMSFTDNVI
jgi:Holliday junction resolvase-like predicted endonuclease